MNIARTILCIVLPPFAVYLRTGLSGHFWLSAALTFLGFLPGIAHALWINAHR